MRHTTPHRIGTRTAPTLFAGLAALALSGWAVSGPEAGVGEFQDHTDIGAPKLAGRATWNAVSQEYVLTAAGVNLWGKRDEFHYAWRRLTGDFILQVRVELVGHGVDSHRKAGLLVRGSLDEDSPYADAVVHGDGLTSLQYRREKAGLTEQIVSATKGADFLQLERRGNRFTMSAARFGEPLSVNVLEDLPLGDEFYVGLFLCSHNPDVVEQAIFRDVRIIRPAKADFTPYRDYIGSVLEILDVETGRRQVVWRSAEPFEAPNWTTDGGSLIYNSSGRGEGRGRLYRFDLATRTSTVIDTGFAIRNNNDHVLSFDGRMLAISDQSQDEGRSTVYTLPTAGGTPRRITPLTPSYLHGWSPDGKWLVYTGGRNGEFDIYSYGKDVAPAEHPYYKQVYLRLMPVAGGAPRVIAYVYGGQGTINVPSWSPDGRMLAFVSNTDVY